MGQGKLLLIGAVLLGLTGLTSQAFASGICYRGYVQGVGWQLSAEGTTDPDGNTMSAR